MIKVQTPLEEGFVQFNADSRLFDLIGRQSVSDPLIALLEVIKNSYDADSTNVSVEFSRLKSDSPTISIVDNGYGMTLDDIRNKWMVIGTDDKIKNPTTPNGRRKVGEVYHNKN